MTGNLRTEVWKIDPPKAAELLANMLHNRPISAITVERYARAMTAGRWMLSGAALSVIEDESGIEPRLLNGAHRMAAVIKSGTTQEFLVVYEDNPDVFRTFDIGRNRSTATLVGMSGQANSVVAAAVIRALLLYQVAPDEPWGRSNIVTGDEVVAFHESLGDAGHAELNDIAHLVYEARWKLRTVGAWYGTLIWLIREHSAQPDLLPDFHAAFCSGAGLPDGDPRLAFRNYVINSPAVRGNASEVGKQALLTIAIRAWNDWLAGEKKANYKFQLGRMLNGRRIQSSLPMPKVR